MKSLLGLIIVCGCGSVNTQQPDGGGGGDDAAITPGAFVWQQNMFGSFPVVSLANNEVHISASQFAPLDLGGGILVPAGGQDVLVARFDAGGAHRTSWRHGGTEDEFQIGLSVDPFGSPALAGLYRGVGNAGGPDLPPAASFNGFVAKYTADGIQQWQLALTSTNEAFPRSSSTNGGSNVAVAGQFTGTLDFAGQQRTSAGGKDAFYVRLNDTGGIASLVTFGGTGDDTGNAALFDPLGTVIFVGTFTGQVTFGSTTLDAGTGRDVFVMRMSVTGVPMWAIQGGGAMDVGDLPSTAVMSNGDVVVAVDYNGTFQMTGGEQVTSLGGSDIALVRVSSAGAVQWTKSFGGAGQDRPRAVAVGSGGDVALTGEFNGSAGFGGDTFVSAGFIDGFVAKYTGDGEHVWSRAAGAGADDRGLGVAVDPSGAVYHTLSFHGTVDVGGGALSAPGDEFNGVLVKYAP